MSEIKNYTMNFSFDRPAGLTFVRQRLVCTEIHCGRALQIVGGI